MLTIFAEWLGLAYPWFLLVVMVMLPSIKAGRWTMSSG